MRMPKLMGCSQAVLRDEFIVINAYVKKRKISSNFTFIS